MKKTVVPCLFLVLTVSAMAQTPAKPPPPDASVQVFWGKFKTAVIKGDKAAVANLSRFPIAMPYLQKNVKTRADLIKRYREVFNHETNAAKCFSKAQPEMYRPGEFIVGCSYPDGGEEVLVYTFTLNRNGWRFSGFDNINE